MKVSKFIKVDRDILLEYIYNDGNLISEPYKILVNSKDISYSYIAGDSSILINKQFNQLFEIDGVSNTYGKVDTNNYGFLQTKDYASGIPIRHDTLKLHLPTNYTFGEYIGCYVRVYTFDSDNRNTYDISNFYFDISDTNTKDILQFDNPPLYFQEKLWAKSITLDVPSVFGLSSQRENGSPKVNSINFNLTNGDGLSLNSPIFIDFHFINKKQIINGITTYLLTASKTVTIPQTPEFERLGLMINESVNGDFFEIYGTYNDNIAEFNDFLVDSVQLGNRYYVQYAITLYEQNIRGKTLTIIVTDNFNEKIEYRPIIKYSTTTAIIDVQMSIIDAVDSSQIIRKASYGMLQDQVSKYSLRLMKINLDNASKPKIYNIKNPLGAGIFGSTASLSAGINQVVLETVKVPFPVLIDRFNIVSKSENVKIGKNIFFGMGKLQLMIYPFDNIIKFYIANNIDQNAPQYLDLTNMGEIKLTIKNQQNSYDFPLFNDSNEVNLGSGLVVFRIPSSKVNDIRKIYDSGINVFYITSYQQNIATVLYTGLFKLYDSVDNVIDLNSIAQQQQQLLSEQSNPTIILDNQSNTGTAIVTRRVVTATQSS